MVPSGSPRACVRSAWSTWTSRRPAGHPVVYADWLHADGAPTVVVYAHYDVQPVDPLELWVRPPFEPRVEGGRIYGRGVADDKGQVHLHLWAAKAWLETAGRLPVNVRYVIEGEEESGSPNFEAWLRANSHRLDADLVVITDTGFYEGNHAAVTVGLRGNMYLQVDVTGPDQDLHSGSFGGLVQNPANALVRILASLRDGEGRVTVPGFYDDVRELTPAEHEALAALPFDESAFAAEIGVPELFGEPGYSRSSGAAPAPRWTSAACGRASRARAPRPSSRPTPTPRCRHAWCPTWTRSASSSWSVMPSWRSTCPAWTWRSRVYDTMKPFVVSVEHPAARIAARCLQEVFGQEPYYIREGGSIGAVASFDQVLGKPAVLLGFTNPDDHAHSPNESLVLANYEGGARTVARYWEALAER